MMKNENILSNVMTIKIKQILNLFFKNLNKNPTNKIFKESKQNLNY